MRLLAVFLIAPLLASCAPPAQPSRREVAAKTPAAMAVPATSRHPLEGGELHVINVPVSARGRHTEHQTCFIWRDQEFKTASLQCPNDRQSYSLEPP